MYFSFGVPLLSLFNKSGQLTVCCDFQCTYQLCQWVSFKAGQLPVTLALLLPEGEPILSDWITDISPPFAKEAEKKGNLYGFPINPNYFLGAVHILRQPKSGVPGPPLPPLSAMVSIWLTPPPPLVSNGQHLACQKKIKFLWSFFFQKGVGGLTYSKRVSS